MCVIPRAGASQCLNEVQESDAACRHFRCCCPEADDDGGALCTGVTMQQFVHQPMQMLVSFYRLQQSYLQGGLCSHGIQDSICGCVVACPADPSRPATEEKRVVKPRGHSPRAPIRV